MRLEHGSLEWICFFIPYWQEITKLDEPVLGILVLCFGFKKLVE